MRSPSLSNPSCTAAPSRAGVRPGGARRRAAVAIAFGALLAMTGCAAVADPVATESAAVVGISQLVQCLDPHQSPRGGTQQVAAQALDRLTDQDPDTGEIVPWIASGWEVNEDATEFVFDIVPGVTFSDGSPLDAAAVVSNIRDVFDLGALSPVGAGYLTSFQSAEVIDETKVRVLFGSSNAQFLYATSTGVFGLISPETLALAADTRCSTPYVGSGPYVIAEVRENESITLESRDEYGWPSSLALHDGPANLDRLEYRFLTDATSRQGQFASGQIDINTAVLRQDHEGVADQILARSSPGTYIFLPNESEGRITADPAVRAALAKAIDQQQLVPLLTDSERPATSLLGTVSPFYRDLSAIQAYDPEAAGALLNAAGWLPGADGTRVKDGVRLALELVYSADEPVTSLYELIGEQLGAVGIELRITPLEYSLNVERQGKGDYDLVSWQMTFADPSVLSSLFLVSTTNPNHRPEADHIDEYVTAIATTTDPQLRQEATDRAVTAILAEAHGIPIFEPDASIAVADHLTGVRFSGTTPILYDADAHR